MPAVGIVLLAAGGSTRLGTPKQLLHFEGKSLLRRAAESAVASEYHPVMVVLGASAEQCRLELQDLPLSVVVNANWEEGMGSSLSLGLKTLLSESPALDAVIIMLCDQPLLKVETLHALTSTYTTSSCLIVASEYGEISGVPALFDSYLFPELLRLTGARGAKQILQCYPEETLKITFPDGAVDIDTSTDYERLNRRP